MYRTISATEAQAQFDEIMAEAVEYRQPILVEQDGKPQVVLLAVEEYERLTADQSQPDDYQPQLDDWEKRLFDLQERIRSETGSRPIPQAAEAIRQMREAAQEESQQQPEAREKSQNDLYELIRKSQDQVAADLQGRPLPDPAEIIRQARQERSEQFLDLLRR